MTSDPNLKQNCLPRREPYRQRHGAPPALARSSLATRKASATSSRPASSRTHAASERVCSALALARYRRCAGSSHFCAPFTMPPVPSNAPGGARRRRKTTRSLEAYCDNVAADRHTVINTSSAGTLGGQGSTAAALHTRKGTARRRRRGACPRGRQHSPQHTTDEAYCAADLRHWPSSTHTAVIWIISRRYASSPAAISA